MSWPGDVLQVLGMTSVITAGIAWLARELVKASLGRDLERHKASLQAANQERQIVFASLHKERAELLRELYRTLPEIADDALRIGQRLSREGANPSDEESAVTSVVKEFQRVLDLYRSNRILFPASLCRNIDELINLIEVALLTGAEKGAAVRLSQQSGDVQVALEREFRSMLGVESEPPGRPKRRWFAALRQLFHKIKVTYRARPAKRTVSDATRSRHSQKPLSKQASVDKSGV
jgi:hypothetical protein